MKILIISTQVPYPPSDGASIRIFNLIRELSRAHEVLLATIVRSPAEQENLDGLRPFCREIHAVSLPRGKWKRWTQILTSPFVRDPHLVRINRSEELQQIVSRLAPQVDVIQAEFPQGGQYINGSANVTVLDEHNVESELLRSACRFDTWSARRFFDTLQLKKMARFESHLCARVDAILATSGDDASLLRTYNRNVMVVPNGIHETTADGEGSAGPVVTFTGLMNYRANVDAVSYFVRSMWPLVCQAVPDAKLYIVGRKPTPEVLRLRSSTIAVTGEVQDVEPYLQRTSVFVAPIRAGSGTRIKILQAMSQSLPVVSTSLGCQGLEVENGKNILIEDDPKAFAARVVSLLRDPSERARIGSAGWNLVNQRYTWRSIGKQLSEAYGTWVSA